MNCTVCGSINDVRNLGTIYTIGSEGTNLCLDCRIMVSEFLRKAMGLVDRLKMGGK